MVEHIDSASDARMSPDEMIEAQYRALMNRMTDALDEAFNGQAKHPHKQTGFVLLMFPYGSHDGRCSCISNSADRKDIVCLMREMIARFEGQPEMVGRG